MSQTNQENISHIDLEAYNEENQRIIEQAEMLLQELRSSSISILQQNDIEQQRRRAPCNNTSIIRYILSWLY